MAMCLQWLSNEQFIRRLAWAPEQPVLPLVYPTLLVLVAVINRPQVPHPPSPILSATDSALQTRPCCFREGTHISSPASYHRLPSADEPPSVGQACRTAQAGRQGRGTTNDSPCIAHSSFIEPAAGEAAVEGAAGIGRRQADAGAEQKLPGAALDIAAMCPPPLTELLAELWQSGAPPGEMPVRGPHCIHMQVLDHPTQEPYAGCACSVKAQAGIRCTHVGSRCICSSVLTHGACLEP